MSKSAQGRTVTRHCVIEVIALQYLAEPSADLRNRFVHPALQRLLNLLQFRSHPFACRLATYDKAALLGPTVVREAQEIEGLRLPLSSLLPVPRSVSPELDQSRLVW